MCWGIGEIMEKVEDLKEKSIAIIKEALLSKEPTEENISDILEAHDISPEQLWDFLVYIFMDGIKSTGIDKPILIEGMDREITIEDFKDSGRDVAYLGIEILMKDKDINQVSILKICFEWIEILVSRERKINPNKWFPPKR
jgi:hypothetical protein